MIIEYIPSEWKVTSKVSRTTKMSNPQTRTSVRFEYLYGDIVIEFGEFNSQRKNKELIINLIELI